MNKTALTAVAAFLGLFGASFADIPAHEDTFLMAGLLQGRVAGSANFTDPITLSDIAIRRELGPIMGLYNTSPNGNNEYAGYQSELDAVKTYWDFNVTFVYVGKIYLDASKVYAFGSRIDDSGYMKIDGEVLYRYTGGGACKSVRYEPAYTGWHDVEIRCGNGAGMAGRNTPYCAIGKIGFCYCSVDKDSADAATIANHVCSGSTEEPKWIKMIDDNTGTLFGTSAETGMLEALQVTYAAKDTSSGNAAVKATIHSAINEAVNIYAWYGPTYGGIDKNSWAHELWIGRTTGTGDDLINADFGVPADTAYVRFIASGANDGTHKWAADTLAVADLGPFNANPEASWSIDSETLTPFTADFKLNVAYMGFAATSWEATLLYGPSPDNLSQRAVTNGISASSAQIHLDNLYGASTVYAQLTVSNDKGGSLVLDNISFATAEEPSLGLLPGLLQGRLDGKRNLTDGLSASTTGVRRELGPVMGLYTDTSGSGMPYTSEIDGEKSYWASQVTYLYVGNIYLDATKTYAFGARNDDSCEIKIDGSVVIAKGNCEHTTTPYVPSYTGWHSIAIRSGNDGGWAGANPYCPIGYKGIVYNAEGRTDHNCQNTHEDETWWIPLKDTGDGTLLGTPGVTKSSDGIAIVSGEKRPSGAAVRLVVKAEDSVKVYAWSGANYGGADESAWASKSGVLASKSVSEGDKAVRVTVPLPADAQYLRFIAVSDRDSSIVWTSPTMLVAGLGKSPGFVVIIR